MKFKNMMYLILALILLGPLWILISGQINFHLDYRTANRDSAHIAPDPHTVSEAVIQAYSARAFNWRGLFAVHTWIAVKEKNADHYKVYQVVGWRLYRGLPAVMKDQEVPDRNWFGQAPTVLLDIRGAKAEKLIPKIEEAADRYPYPDEYVVWPGPNSNTFTAFIGREVPDLQLTLPSIAVGKDFLVNKKFFARAPSGTGYQISLYGLLGVTIARREGFELNLLGAVFGFSLQHFAIKLPAIGEIGFIQAVKIQE